MTVESPRPGPRVWTIAGLTLLLVGLATVAFDVSDWARLASGNGGLLALGGGVLFAFSSVVVLRLSVSAFRHAWRGDPKPKVWQDAIFDRQNRRQTP